SLLPAIRAKCSAWAIALWKPGDCDQARHSTIMPNEMKVNNVSCSCDVQPNFGMPIARLTKGRAAHGIAIRAIAAMSDAALCVAGHVRAFAVPASIPDRPPPCGFGSTHIGFDIGEMQAPHQT